MFLADAIRAVDKLFQEQDECGGTQVDFIRWLDYLVLDSLPEIQLSDPVVAVELARKFRDEVLARVAGYDPRRDYSM